MTKSPDGPDRSAAAWERYRLAAQRPEIEGEGWATGAGPFAPAPPPGPPVPETGMARLGAWFRRSNKVELTIIVLSIAGILGASWLFISGRGVGTVGLFALLATAPLALVMTVLVRADRFAPIGARYLALSALWGAGVATTVAALVNSGLFADFTAITGDISRAQVLSAVVVAPVSEELMKGAGAVLVLLLARNRVVSATNGLVVAGASGAAFAFVENIQYFLQAHAEGTAVLGFTILGRLVLSPFIHPMATSFIGFFFAAAILKRGGGWAWTWRLLVGFLLAVAVHALWNGLATLGTTWVLLYLLIELPLFTAWLIWVSTRGRRQLARVAAGLDAYVATGWISPEEARMVTEWYARRYARKWARKIGRPAPRELRRYLQTAGRLGLDQVNMETTGADPARIALARQALTALAEYRENLLRIGAARTPAS